MRIINKKPVLFEKSNHNIWTDPYIQQQILKKHLDFQSDEASRRQESVLKIVNFVLKHSKPKSHLLDLGCGPGLYTSLFADANYIVTGIDFNKSSICLLYTSDAADDTPCVDLGGRRIIKKIF